MTRRTVLVVAAALYDAEGRILLAQRPAGKSMAGLWEFPGGKIEPGETPEQALVRELHEELSIMVDETSLKPITFASHAYPDFHLLMPLFSTESWEGELAPREGQTLAWVRSSDLHLYPAPAADIPLFDVLSGK
jgi:8-oxo-dGTP diphosphatase